MNTRQLLSAGVAALLVVAASAAWLTRDQRQINGNLNQLRKLISKSEEEKGLGGLIRAKEITGYFTASMDVNLGTPWPDFKDRDELATAIHHALSMAQTIKVIIRNKTLDFSPDRKSAMMVIATEAVVTFGGQTDRDVRELRLIWVKQQGKWLISKVERKETIHRPPGLGDTKIPMNRTTVSGAT
jgi:hypothetical protein